MNLIKRATDWWEELPNSYEGRENKIFIEGLIVVPAFYASIGLILLCGAVFAIQFLKP